MTSPSTKKQLTVEGVMHSGVVTCKPEATLRAVAEILATHRIHAVVVASRDEKAPCAVVSDRDVVYAQSTWRRRSPRHSVVFRATEPGGTTSPE
jgi:CBS domain-containing protein